MARWLVLVCLVVVGLAAHGPGASAGAVPDLQDAQATGSEPVSIRIPQALVDTTIEPLGINSGIPEDPNGTWVVGWFRETARLGVSGNAVMYGYRSFAGVGPSVFSFLDQVTAGDRVEVTGDDGNLYRYRVASVETHDRAAAPLGEIFGPTEEETLTLMTDAPPYDATGYLAVLVVRATRRAGGAEAAPAAPPAAGEIQDGCSPQTFDLPGGPATPVQAEAAARAALRIPEGKVAGDEVITSIDKLLDEATECEVAVREALILPDERVLAVIGPSGPLPLAAVTGSGDFEAIATEPQATICAFVLFTPEAGGWVAAGVPYE